MVSRRHQERWLSLNELGALHGYPTYPMLAEAAGVPLFSLKPPGWTHSRVRQSLGNCMHVPSVGVVMLA
eukprot:12631980-Alexandrium_andersonii.AAC.1